MSLDDLIDTHGNLIPTIDETLLVRGKTHGNYKEQGAFADSLKEKLGEGPNWKDMSGAQRDALCMIMMKVSRILHGDPNERDHWKDIAGYSTLIMRIVEVQNEK